MIRLLVLFFIFIFMLIPSCYNLGKIVLKKLKIDFNKYLTIFIGFILTLGIFQLVYYPAMVLQLPSIYLTITGTIIIIILLFLTFKNIDSFKCVFKDKYIWIILFLSFLTFYLYMRTMPFDFWYFDDAFYFPFMYENAIASRLLSVEPRSGEIISKIGNIYASQGYYMIGSYIISLYNIFKDVFLLKYNYMSNIYYFMSFPAFLMMFISLFGMANQLSTKFWKKLLFISLYVFSIVFLSIDSNLLNNILMTGYIGVFFVLNVFVPFLIFLIFNYIKGDRKNAYLISLMFLVMLSCASFNIFIIFILLYSLLLILYLTKRDKHINDFLIMLFPAMLFLMDFIFSNNIISFVGQALVIIIYFLIYKFNEKILLYEKKLFNILKYVIYFFIFVPIILSILFIVLKIEINCSTSEYLKNLINALFPLFGTQTIHYSYVISTIFNLIFLFLTVYLIIFRNKKTNIVILYIFIVAGIFLNPFSIPFISTALTSETYNRIFVLIFNPFIYYSVLKYFLEKLNCKKIINIGCIVLMILCTLIQLKEFEYWVSINGRSDKLYRMRERDVVASIKLDSYAKKNNIKNIRIATIHSELKILNPNIFSQLDRTLKYVPDDTFTKKAFYISTIYYLNKGEIKQEYLDKYNSTLIDALNYLDINFITINLECPVLNEQNTIPNVLCEKPVKQENLSDEKYLEILDEYKQDKKIYNEFLDKLELVYQTERYRLYYVKGDE